MNLFGVPSRDLQSVYQMELSECEHYTQSYEQLVQDWYNVQQSMNYWSRLVDHIYACYVMQIYLKKVKKRVAMDMFASLKERLMVTEKKREYFSPEQIPCKKELSPWHQTKISNKEIGSYWFQNPACNHFIS